MLWMLRVRVRGSGPPVLWVGALFCVAAGEEAWVDALADGCSCCTSIRRMAHMSHMHCTKWRKMAPLFLAVYSYAGW